ncbi:MAG: lipopolysaccharide transport system ATP-binding protein [Pyrinomonadaceae bacterium]|nr:lipopolysaccharide transport system ATP-binding protein [Pyrinomonadaceae bacterium]
MSKALRVEGVAKQYRIYEHPSDRLKETLTRGWLKRHREFWALREISFEIERGTTVGIVGPNGSGKSTLLQIITGTLAPTHGDVQVEGRVAALLELGAGFNLEFTGLENVYMNAALMGFSRADTDARLARIERFAEIGDFLHQPVKTYSSGMYVRLAFAIAVNTDPDILVVDEALSVGDTIFQHRCVRRIKEMQEAGTTILFVSHEPTLVRALCSRAILLNAGRMIADGTPMEVLNRYQRVIMAREEAYAGEGDGAETTAAGVAATQGDEMAAGENEDAGAEGAAGSVAVDAAGGVARQPLQYSYRHGNKRAEVIGAELVDGTNGRAVELVETGDAVAVRLRVLFHEDVAEPVCGFMIRNRHGINVYGTNTEQRGQPMGAARRGDVIEAVFTFRCWLGQEHYFVSVAAHTPDGEAFDWLDGAIFFRVSCAVEMEGIANLDARVTTRRVGVEGRDGNTTAAMTGGESVDERATGDETRAIEARAKS